MELLSRYKVPSHVPIGLLPARAEMEVYDKIKMFNISQRFELFILPVSSEEFLVNENPSLRLLLQTILMLTKTRHQVKTINTGDSAAGEGKKIEDY